MENIKKQRSIVKSSITRIKTFVTNNDTVSNINVSEYVTREVFLEKAYKNYCKIQNNIELMDQSDETGRDDVETKYLSLLSKLKAKIRQMSKQLRGFLTHIKQHVNSLLVALKLPVKEWYLILVYPFTQKFDYQTHRAYELEKNIGLISSDKQALLPTLDAFLTFLEKRCTALENIEVDNSKTFNNHGNKNMSGEKNERKSFFAQKQNHSFAGQK
ncbi:hypothetical protein HUJ04_003251, partial [Dendroctonus ponderosae]